LRDVADSVCESESISHDVFHIQGHFVGI